MAVDRPALRDWHRLFGLVLADFFTGTPFTVEIERDLSEQQQFLDVAIVRRGRGRFRGRLPDGLEELVEHNLITFKSFHEALDAWAMRELVSHYVAYRKLVSPSPSTLLPESHFRLYAVTARFPQNLANQVPWQERQAGVYDCRWGLDVVRVVVAGQLPRERQNAPLQLFSASPELVGFARVGGLRPRRLRAAFGGHKPIAGAITRKVSGGGFYHVVYDGGFQASVHQRPFRAAIARGAGAGVAVAAGGEAPGGDVRGAGSSIPREANRPTPIEGAQDTSEEVECL
jgi:hypothetical protein